MNTKKEMKHQEAIEFTEKMLKDQKHWLNHFIYMNKTRYSDYTSEIKNKRYCVNYLKYILKILKGEINNDRKQKENY